MAHRPRIVLLAALCFAACSCSNEQVASVLRPSLMGAAAANSSRGGGASASPFGFLDGARIVASDGQFLGIVSTNQYDANSIANSYGNYGSEYSSTSIFNKFSSYGGQYSAESPFNPYSSTPPKMFTRDGRWTYLTVNNTLRPAFNPHMVIATMHSNQ